MLLTIWSARAMVEGVDFVLIAGDLYDGDWKDYNTGLHLVSQTAKLREAGIAVYIAAGNHDAASKITKKLKLPENVHLFSANKPETFTIDELNVAIHGQSFAKPAIKTDLSNNYPAPLPGHFNIGVLHTCASGREGHEPYAPCTLEGLGSKEYNYWALGHVHQYETLLDDPLVVFSGCIQGRHIRETGPKGCVLVTVDDQGQPQPAFRPLDVIRWVIADVDAGGAESAYDVVDRVGRQLEKLVDQNEGLPLVVRVVIQGETSGHAELLADVEHWGNEIRSAAIDSGGRVWVEKIKFHTALAGCGTRSSKKATAPLVSWCPCSMKCLPTPIWSRPCRMSSAISRKKSPKNSRAMRAASNLTIWIGSVKF